MNNRTGQRGRPGSYVRWYIFVEFRTKHIFAKEWNSESRVLTNPSGFIHSVDKNVLIWVSVQSCLFSGTETIPLHCFCFLEDYFCACHYVFPAIPMSISGWIYSKCVCSARFLYCNFVSAVQSVPLLNLTVSFMKFFSLFLFSYGICRCCSRNTCHSHLESV